MRKKEVSSLGVVLLISIFFIIGGVMFLAVFEPRDSLTGMAAGGTPGPPAGGGGGGGGTTTTTTGSGGRGGPLPVKISFITPKDGDTIKRGVLTLLVGGFERRFLDPFLAVEVISPLFKTTNPIKLINNFGGVGTGIYGANITIGRNISQGTYEIIATGKRRTFDTERILVTLDPTIYLNISLKKAYYKGERINFEGTAQYFNHTPVSNISLTLTIAAPGFRFNKTLNTSRDGRFSGSYPISFAEPDGMWRVQLSAADKQGNDGALVFTPNVSMPPGIAYYTVTFLSPLQHAEFKRSDFVPITVEITDEGKNVSNATVDMRTPWGEVVMLKEVQRGTYSFEYPLKPDDPLGQWYVSVQAVKTVAGVTKAGGNRIPITIQLAAMQLTVLEPTETDFFTGQSIDFLSRLNYKDGRTIENAYVVAMLGNKTLTLVETEPGLYSTRYIITPEDIAGEALSYRASDIHGNMVELPAKAIKITPVARWELILKLFYHNVLVRYWYFFVLSVFIVIAITQPLWYNTYLRSSLKYVTKHGERIIEMEKDCQRKYFKQHRISRQEYDKLMVIYREKEAEVKERCLYLDEKMNKQQKLFNYLKKNFK